MTDAIILAGGNNDQEFLKKFGVNNRSLLVIHNKFMIEYVIEALKEVSSIKRIVVVGPVKELKSRIGKSVEEVVPPGNDPFESTLKGLEYLNSENKVLVISSDIPLIKGDMIEDFFLRCSKQLADFYYPIVRKEVYQKKFGQSKRTFAKLVEGSFGGGNMLLIDPTLVQKKREFISKIIRNRKSPITIARILGLNIIIKYILKKLSVKDVEERVARILGMKGIAIITPYPEIKFDVDLTEHVDIAKRFLKK
ncbi:MAG: nucleotidyltransferase family protein [Candidatus Atribacteria bacterium]|nr:nucleotidyltransferase family protein [Candidatus Atribacteria bacterium]